MSVYSGVSWQKGYGLGSVFGHLRKITVPLLKSVGTRVGKKMLKTGVGLAEDVLRGKNLRDAAKARLASVAVDTINSAINDRAINNTPKRGRPRKRKATAGRARGRGSTRGRGRPRKRGKHQWDVFD